MKFLLALIALVVLLVPAHGETIDGKCYVWWKNADDQPVMGTGEKCLITLRPKGSFDVRPKGLPHPLIIVERGWQGVCEIRLYSKGSANGLGHQRRRLLVQ